MKVSWTNSISKDYAEDVKKEFASSATMRKRLIEMLEERKKSAYEDSLKKDAYNSPNWGFQQADAVGYQRALNDVISLLGSQK